MMVLLKPHRGASGLPFMNSITLSRLTSSFSLQPQGVKICIDKAYEKYKHQTVQAPNVSCNAKRCIFMRLKVRKITGNKLNLYETKKKTKPSRLLFSCAQCEKSL